MIVLFGERERGGREGERGGEREREMEREREREHFIKINHNNDNHTIQYNVWIIRIDPRRPALRP